MRIKGRPVALTSSAQAQELCSNMFKRIGGLVGTAAAAGEDAEGMLASLMAINREWTLEEPLELVHFVEILNLLDERLEKARKSCSLLQVNLPLAAGTATAATVAAAAAAAATTEIAKAAPSSSSSSSSSATTSHSGGGSVGSDEEEPSLDVQMVKEILRFTALLLGNTMNKEIYNSTEVCIRFHTHLYIYTNTHTNTHTHTYTHIYIYTHKSILLSYYARTTTRWPCWPSVL